MIQIIGNLLEGEIVKDKYYPLKFHENNLENILNKFAYNNYVEFSTIENVTASKINATKKLDKNVKDILNKMDPKGTILYTI